MKRFVAALIAGLALAGCAGIPDSGSIHKVETPQEHDESTVRYAPAGPIEDATPRQIVSGFLDAMLAYPVTTGVAASFLTPDGAKNWKSSEGVQIYVAPTVSASTAVVGTRPDAAPASLVKLSLHTEAELDIQGKYDTVDKDKTYRFTLKKIKGQWRIDNPPDGFLVNKKFFNDYYRPFSLYFFDRPGKRLVAVPIYLPIGDQLATSMMTSLLRGPRGNLSGYARSFIPRDAQLQTAVPAAPDGVAEVTFKEDLVTLPATDKERLAAQIVWTLSQVDGISGVQIVAADNAINPNGFGPQSLDDWAAFGPSRASGTFFGIKNDTVVRMSGKSVGAVVGDWGKDAHGARTLAVNGSEERLAILPPGRDLLEIGGLTSGAKTVLAQYKGTDFSTPVFDDRGQVWAFDRAGDKTRLRHFDKGKFASVDIGTLAQKRIVSFALSPGQSHYAVVASGQKGNSIYVGDVLAGKDDVVQGLSSPRKLDVARFGITDVRSISWEQTATVAFLGSKARVGDQVFRARIDGSEISGGTATDGPLLPDVEAVGLAVSGNSALGQYVADSKGRFWWQSGNGAWQVLEGKKLYAPTYAG